MTKLVVIVGFFVSFAAGLMVGMETHRPGAASPTTRPSRRGWLVSELNLTPQQQEQMNKIWSDTAGHGRGDQGDRRRQFRKERDEAIAALIRPEDKAKYDEAVKNYTEQAAAMEREARKSFDDAVKRTEEFLSPEQRAKYEELLSHRWGRDRDRDRDRDNRRGDAGATSKPSSLP